MRSHKRNLLYYLLNYKIHRICIPTTLNVFTSENNMQTVQTLQLKFKLHANKARPIALSRTKSPWDRFEPIEALVTDIPCVRLHGVERQCPRRSVTQ